MTTSKNFYSSIIELLKQEIPPSHINEKGEEENSICAKLGISKQNLSYYLAYLSKEHLIEKIEGIWKIGNFSGKELENIVKKRSKKNLSRGMNIGLTTNLHALEIKFPILQGKIQDSSWEVKNKLKNWLPKYKGLTNLGGLSIRNNNNKSLTVYAKARDIKNLEEVDNLAFKIRTFVYEYFKSKHNVILDVFNCETKNLNLATGDKPCEGMLRKGEKFELGFDKNAEKIFPQDKIPSKAWMDGSPFKFTAETNDKDWKRAYLTMPFIVQGLAGSMPAIQEYNRNILLHMSVQNAQLKTQHQIQNLLSRLDVKLGKKQTRASSEARNQKKLSEFIN